PLDSLPRRYPSFAQPLETNEGEFSPTPSAVFLHSFPAPPPVTEAGLSLDEPAEPTTNVTTDRDRGYTARVQAELRHAEDVASDDPADRLSVPDGPDPDQGYGQNSAGASEPASPASRSPKKRQVLEAAGEASALGPDPESPLQDLSPGSEVRVSLDHVIDDALVVSFRLGDRVFSGVLMDVSRRFGPYGIPITVFPRRDDRSPPAVSLQLVTNDDPSTKQEVEEVSATPLPPPHPWTSKPPPLFQEGAAYPPPLFIRDTYNQALPQPPPRKIKRPKRRYRCEEPTSIMNAIKLRPRQVLCDKCKGVVAPAGQREARRGPVDLRGEEASRRRKSADVPISAEVKRLRSDDRVGRTATDRRSSSGMRVSSSSSSSSSRRILRDVAPSTAAASSSRMRLGLNSKKVLTKGSAVDRSKARQALKKLTRTALQNHNQKVHFTRRLQHLSAAPAGSASHTTLPPRMRLKPQRYPMYMFFSCLKSLNKLSNFSLSPRPRHLNCLSSSRGL
uniref:PWWP domain containing 2A n=1 Tax=Salarias fasciatus TaxID=181472 RepID=A0A672H9S6_SALFA